MKTNRLPGYEITLAALFSVAVILSATARAQEVTATFTNSFGNGVWEHDAHIGQIGNPNDPSVVGNWSTLAYPTNHHHITDPNTGINYPNDDPTYDVVLGINGCSLGASVTVLTTTVASTITLDLVPGANLRIAGATGITNTGTILINPSAVNTPAGIQFVADSTLSGTGSVQLNGIKSFDDNYPGFADAYIYNGDNSTGNGKTVTHGAGHLIHGRGDLASDDNAAVFINNGTVDADVSASLLRVYFSLQAGNKNNATLEATNGGTLYVENGFVDQSGGGTLFAADNSLVQLGSISANRFLTVAGGTFTTAGTGVVEASYMAIDGCTNSGAMELLPADYAQIKANGLTNNGTVLVNTTAAHTPTGIQFVADSMLAGTGSITLNGVHSYAENYPSGADAYIYNGGNSTGNGKNITHGANHLIDGRGDLNSADNSAVFINNGTVDADVSGGLLRVYFSLQTGNKNNGVIEATNGGTLYFEQGFVDQSGGGTLSAANGSLMQLGNIGINRFLTVSGGTFTTAGAGVIDDSFLVVDGCTNAGAMEMLPGDHLDIRANGLTNNGTILVNTTAANTSTGIQIQVATQVGGSGSIQLNGIKSFDDNYPSLPDASIYSGSGSSGTGVPFTNGTHHLIHGRGDILFTNGGSVFTNNGTINADFAGGGKLRLNLTNDANNQNNATIEATNGGLLGMYGGTIDQTGGGTFLADGSGSIVQFAGDDRNNFATVRGGTLNTTNAGVVQGSRVILAGAITNGNVFEIPSNGTTLSYATTLTNNGAMTLDDNTALLRFDQNNTAIGGEGSIALTSGAIMRIGGGQSVTNGSNHTLKGNGTLDIQGTLTNNGTIAPGLSPGELDISGNLTLGYASSLSFEIGGTSQGTTYDLLKKTDNTALSLNGKLSLSLTNGFTPSNSDTFTILTTTTALAGAFTNVKNGGRINTEDGSGSFQVTYHVLNNAPLSSVVTLSSYGAALPPSQGLNISSRADVQTGDSVTIGGFVVGGTDSKKVLIRGIGPSLTNSGLQNVLADPTLELHTTISGQDTVLASNDNWKDTQQAQIQPTGLAPSNDLESAIVITLSPGVYTAILQGKNNGVGIGLVEVYDLDAAANSKLANISTRGFVGTGDNVLIGGTIIGPSTGNSSNVLVCARGPSLQSPQITNALADPVLELHDSNGALFAVNDNWKDTQQTAIAATTLQPTNDAESAIIVSLANGAWTAIVRGKNNTSGVALVEIYSLP